ncbi:hypothetical protein KUL118_05470 [Tenacibaculum sp. KUL118]|nr:hypothetical protein KUL118_05470 [Tenacibaculum sp. KUL118]
MLICAALVIAFNYVFLAIHTQALALSNDENVENNAYKTRLINLKNKFEEGIEE